MSFIYATSQQSMLTGGINWLTNTLGALLVTNGYIPNQATDVHVADIPSAAILSRVTPLPSPTIISGAAAAGNVTFHAVSGSGVYYVVIYKVVGGDSTSPLIALISQGTGLPLFPTGSDVVVNWDTGPNHIFSP